MKYKILLLFILVSSFGYSQVNKHIVKRHHADYLGKIVFSKDPIKLNNFDLTNHFEDDLLYLEKFKDDKIFSAAFFDADQDYYYLKRFTFEPAEKLLSFIGDNPKSKLIRITEVDYPRLELRFGGKNKDRDPEIIEVAEFIGVKSFRARGKRLSTYEVSVIKELEPLMKADEDPQENPGNSDSDDKNSGNGQMSLNL
jgi:topoisomerase-4 subunit A